MYEKDVSCKNCGPRLIDTDGYPVGSQNAETLSDKSWTGDDETQVQNKATGTAPVMCETVEGFFGLESRMAINRVLRTYLESSFLTPTELLHGHRELQRLDDRGSLLPAAVSHVARLQTRDTERPAKDREEELYGLVDKIVLRARRADPVRLPKLSRRFSDTLAAVSHIGYDDPEYLAMVVLSRELSGIRSWVGRLDRLCTLAMEETDGKSILLLDTVIADMLGANVIQELLDAEHSQGDTIISMLDLADGTYAGGEGPAAETVTMLNKLMADDVLPASRHVLIARALSQLLSAPPLHRADPSRERQEYQRVLARLLVLSGVISGAHIADAIASHGTGYAERDEAVDRRVVVKSEEKAEFDANEAFAARPGPESAEKPLDAHLEDIVNQLDDIFRERIVGELYRRTMSLKDQMASVTGAYTKLQKTQFARKNIGWA